MEVSLNVRTDLALEAREDIKPKKGEIDGVIMSVIPENNLIKVTFVEIQNERGSALMKKPCGKYYTVEASDIQYGNDEYKEEVSKVIHKYLRELSYASTGMKNPRVLVVGLGNREVTPDSVGPNAVDMLEISENIMGVAPGVLAQTGMETARIVKGIAAENRPDLVIAVDALAARSTKRLNTTIQLSNTGIHPGSGVGNHRWGITEENIGVPIIAIGVPTVVDAPTIISDTLDNILNELQPGSDIKKLNNDNKYELIKKLIMPEIAQMFVTPKDIDATAKILGLIIANAINMTFDVNNTAG